MVEKVHRFSRERRCVFGAGAGAVGREARGVNPATGVGGIAAGRAKKKKTRWGGTRRGRRKDYRGAVEKEQHLGFQHDPHNSTNQS